MAKINKMKTEDIRAAIALHKDNRGSKYFKDLCAELNTRVNRKAFIKIKKTIWNYNTLLAENKYFHSLVRRLANPELI